MNYNEIKLNQLEVRNFDVRHRFSTDWVTEYTYISENNLSLKDFEELLKDKVYGELNFIKKVMNFRNGKKLYKHICEAVMY